jgi:hypothetical protein
VDSCPTGAFSFGNEEDFKEQIAKAEILKPENKPRTYYIGIPKRFVAGAVYDPEADECLEGVGVTLKDAKGKKVATAKTDNFGDFWFEGLKVGEYSLSIEKAGYLPQQMANISTEKDINVGEIALYQKV